MVALSVGDLVQATGGALLRGDPGAIVDSYSIDSRHLQRGGAFFALRGGRTDGHQYVPAAAEAGAGVAVVQDDPPSSSPTPPAVIRVADTVGALALCGAAARRHLPIRVVAITGSTGKTTTKELLAAGLAARRRVHRSEGNLNNHLGMPLTLLNCADDAEVVVVEMGMSAPGEIASLMRIADPDIGLVTNVRPVHLEFFDSVDDIAAAKGEMYAMLRPESIAVVNFDDERCRVQSARHAGPRVTFGRHPSADLVLESVEDRFVPGASFRFRHGSAVRSVQLRIGGAHAAYDALAALAGVLAAGEDLDAAVDRMERVEPAPGRGTVHRLANDVVIVDDTYNSNPAALGSVLDTLEASPAAGRKVLVMGDMLELGPEETALHRAAGRRAAAAGVELLVGVGARSRFAVEAARKARVREAVHEPDAAAAARSIVSRIRRGDLVVVKGSRGMRLEQVVQALLEGLGEAR